MITAFFTPYYKFLQKGNYLKFFDVETLSDLIDKIKVEDKVTIYARSKDIIKFQFKNTLSNVECVFLEDDILFDGLFNQGDKVRAKVKECWQNLLGKTVYLVQDREELLKTVEAVDLLAFQATDINELKNNLINNGEIGEKLVGKMFLTDDVLATLGGR